MEALLTAIGIVLAVFLVLSAAVESVVDVIRGFTGKLLPALNGAISLDDALRQAQAFAPDNAQLQARLDAIKAAADRVRVDVSGQLNQVKAVAAGITGTLSDAQAAQLTERMNGLATQVSTAIDNHERHRILLVRLLSGLIGIGIAYSADINAFAILAEQGGERLNFFDDIPTAIGILLTGLSAAGGSSYWHDKLDKVRSVKKISEQASGVRT